MPGFHYTARQSGLHYPRGNCPSRRFPMTFTRQQRRPPAGTGGKQHPRRHQNLIARSAQGLSRLSLLLLQAVFSIFSLTVDSRSCPEVPALDVPASIRHNYFGLDSSRPSSGNRDTMPRAALQIGSGDKMQLTNLIGPGLLNVEQYGRVSKFRLVGCGETGIRAKRLRCGSCTKTAIV